MRIPLAWMDIAHATHFRSGGMLQRKKKSLCMRILLCANGAWHKLVVDGQEREEGGKREALGEARDGIRTKTYRRSCSLAGFGVAFGKERIAVAGEVAHGCDGVGGVGSRCAWGVSLLALIDGVAEEGEARGGVAAGASL